ncbi:MAG: MarR family winged helix-turn-helix transcriptional regulator [Caldimonas sp.]
MDIVDLLAPRGFDCVCGNLRMAARAVSSVYDRHLRAAGIQSSQMSVIWAVAGTQGLAVKELAARIAMDETTLIRNLRGLERQGWVTLAVGADRRRRLASLTDEGRAVFARALPLWKKAQQEVSSVLDDKMVETNRKLVRLTRAIA